MSTTPSRPGTEPQVTEEEKELILERLATFEKDRKSAVDAHEALAKIRRTLKSPGNSRGIA
jgi:hypothetical protein